MLKSPIIGISCGDTNGVGTEILIKSINRIVDLDILVVFFGSIKLLNFYDKNNEHLSRFNLISNISDVKKKYINIFNCLDESIEISPGKITSSSGNAAYSSLDCATNFALDGKIDILITMPLCKNNVKQPFVGHTEYLRDRCGVSQNLMLLVSNKIKLATLTNHIPIKSISSEISINKISNLLEILAQSLEKDFNIMCPKLAVLGLNPHTGDNGLVGKEEIDIISPAIKQKQLEGLSVSGPFSADAFFAKKKYTSFDAVLSMFHDQGLIPFKMLSSNCGGVNYTAGMPIIRFSPDHGPAYDIVGKDSVNCDSFLKAVRLSVEVYNNR